MLQVTILGCSASLGTPVLGCKCNICNSDSSYNKRSRSSIYIQSSTTKILVDFGFDIRTQLLREKITDIDIAILTHDHADHVSGIDELRVFSFSNKMPFKIITSHYTAGRIHQKYGYLFEDGVMQTQAIDFFDNVKIGDITVQFFRQQHGKVDSLGLRIGNFVYSTDISDFPTESREFLHNIDTWILDCFDYTSNPNHAGLDKILNWNDLYKPKQIFLTNMSHKLDYHNMSEHLPNNIAPLYDGFIIKL